MPMLRAILVDDETVILKKIQAMVKDSGLVEVVGAYTDPLTALLEATETKPDCALLDIEMPGLSGIELAERLASLNSDLEVVFITAYNHYAAQAFEVNALDYLLKPIRPERLEKAVKKVLRRRDGKPQESPSACIIRCFGCFEVLVGGQAVKWSRSKARELLAYMLQYEGKWLSKYRLCDELLADHPPERALAYLQICMHALRRSLREAGCTQIQIHYANDKYILTVTEADWDLRSFEQAYQTFGSTALSEHAGRALACYRGEYLEGEDWLWVDILREDYICRADVLKGSGAGMD